MFYTSHNVTLMDRPTHSPAASSEGIAYGEVEGHGFAEGFHVVIAVLAGIVGGMDTDAEVGTDHKH